MATTRIDATPMASKPTCDAGCHGTLGRERPSGSICDSLTATEAASTPTNVRSTCPSGVLRHLVTSKHVRDTSVRKWVAGRHYPIHRGRCVTLQHRRFHTGSVGVRGSSPLSSTQKPSSGLLSNVTSKRRNIPVRASLVATNPAESMDICIHRVSSTSRSSP